MASVGRGIERRRKSLPPKKTSFADDARDFKRALSRGLLRGGAASVIIMASLTLIASIFGRVAFAVAASVLAFTVVYVSSTRVRTPPVDEQTRFGMGSGAAALALIALAAILSAVAAAAFVCGALIAGAGASGAAIAAACSFSLLYMTAIVMCAAAKHMRRVRLIFSVAGLYTLGFLVLAASALCVSRVDLGGSDAAIVMLSLIYSAVCAVRCVYLFFILKSRIKSSWRLRR